jgi:HEAT repeat protein
MKEEEKQRILSALSSNVEEIRYRAVQRLPEIYSDLPVNETIRALGDASWRIRKSVSAMLSEAETGSEMITALIKALGEEKTLVCGIRPARFSRTSAPRRCLACFGC